MNNLLNLVIVAVFAFEAVKATEGNFSTSLENNHTADDAVLSDCWTEWFDRDDSSESGDWETLSGLREEYPGKICPNPSDIEFRTRSNLTVDEAGDVVKADAKLGFICMNQDQPDGECNVHEVRFKCPSSYCAGEVCWTRWYNRDEPDGLGDWETLKDLRKENPGEICVKPQDIEAVTVDELAPALETGEDFIVYSPTRGFICRNEDQKNDNCSDYKVRFACPCAPLNGTSILPQERD